MAGVMLEDQHNTMSDDEERIAKLEHEVAELRRLMDRLACRVGNLKREMRDEQRAVVTALENVAESMKTAQRMLAAQAEMITTRRLVIVGDDGRPTMILHGNGASQHGGIELHNHAGQCVLLFTHNADGGLIGIQDHQGRALGSLRVIDGGGRWMSCNGEDLVRGWGVTKDER